MSESSEPSIRLPSFAGFDADQVLPQLRELLARGRLVIDRLCEQETPTWEGFVEPLDVFENELSQFWSPVRHLHSVKDSAELREVYRQCQPMISEFYTEQSQNEGLCRQYQRLVEGEAFGTYTQAQQQSLRNALRDFRLAGVDLPEEQKSRFKAIVIELTKLTTQFEQNLLDATQGWHLDIDSAEQLTGLPDHALDLLAQYARRAEAGDESVRWRITLEAPSFLAVMKHADSRELREQVYTAYVTRASDIGPNGGQWDNGPLIDQILELRAEQAALLGFASYAEYSVATKMVDSPSEVTSFLEQLAVRAKPQGEVEVAELRDFARERFGLITLEPWDVAWCSEKLREERFAISDEMLKPYFPEPTVVEGLFKVCRKLFGLSFKCVDDPDIWHPQVQLYQVFDRSTQLRGLFYLDLYAREHKRGGAWMDECVSRLRIDGQLQLPVAYLTCNLTPPVDNQPALFTHSEVITLFHEFGHGLHHLLTRIDTLSVSGIHGVQWDAVELPSQLLENWCWQKKSLAWISGHFETGEPLPDTLLEKAQKARNFQAAMAVLRQLEFGLFDMRLHQLDALTQSIDVQQLLDQVRHEVAVTPQAGFNRFQNGFSHIFAGGYAAGYYSYKWAEVLSADVFSAFEEKGVVSAEVGRAFVEHILSRGGERDAMDMFVEFRGRKPELDAFLRHNGLAA